MTAAVDAGAKHVPRQCLKLSTDLKKWSEYVSRFDMCQRKMKNMATISKEIRLTLDECKEGIKLFLKERMGVDVHPSDIVFDAVYTSGGHGDNGPPKTTGCTIRFKDEKL